MQIFGTIFPSNIGVNITLHIKVLVLLKTTEGDSPLLFSLVV